MTSLRKRRVEEAVAKVWKRLSKFSEALAFPGFSNPLFSSFIYVHLLISSHFHWPDRVLDACNTHSDLITVCNEHLAQKGGVLDLHHSPCPRQPILFNYDILINANPHRHAAACNNLNYTWTALTLTACPIRHKNNRKLIVSDSDLYRIIPYLHYPSY